MQLDERYASTTNPATGSLELSETSELSLQLFPDQFTNFEARVVVGDAVVASTTDRDRPEFLLRLPWDHDDNADYYSCAGRLLRDWVGRTELRVEVAQGDIFKPVLCYDLEITAGKLEQEAFGALCAAIADHSAAILLDVYGKTFLGLEAERKLGEDVPLATLHRIKQALEQLTVALRAIAHSPAYRLKSRKVREPALAMQSVSDLTLEEACIDPSIVFRTGGSIRFREHVREWASPSFDLPENRVISGFLGFVSLQLADLRMRMEREIEMHLERRSYRHRRIQPNEKTWWESEDLPRIVELQKLLKTVAAMERDTAHLRRHEFLPEGARLTETPVSTPLIRSNRAYETVYKVIAAHFSAFRVHLDDRHLVLRAKSLPVLYEWWCLLEVIRSLQGCLELRRPEAGSPFKRLTQDRDRLVVDFADDQQVDFVDERGRLVRLRYVPHYHSLRDSRGATYGQLGGGRERTPDITLEIFPANSDDAHPELIIVLDAKYSSESHGVKLDEVQRKYGKIGVFETGLVLSRQVWAMAPTPAPGRHPAGPEWAAFCTLDNLAFWSDAFDMRSTVAGVVQVKPLMPAGRPPIDSLLRLLLRRSGIAMRGEQV
jgi:hypothetical protein